MIRPFSPSVLILSFKAPIGILGAQSEITFVAGEGKNPLQIKGSSKRSALLNLLNIASLTNVQIEHRPMPSFNPILNLRTWASGDWIPNFQTSFVGLSPVESFHRV